MRTSLLTGLACVTALFAFAPACGSSSGGSGFGDSSGSSGGSSSSTGSSGGSSSGSSGGSSSGLLGDGGSSGDGTTICAPNPGNYDVPGNNCDDDQDGMVDNTPHCDGSLTTTGSAHDMAASMGLCQDASGPKWGIVSATFTQGYNSNAAPNDGQHGILPKFGGLVMPREGSQLGVLSSGWAREWDDQQGASTGPCVYPPTSMTSYGAPCFKGLQMPMTGAGSAPPNYPKAAAGCMNANSVQDAIGLTLQIKVPLNANGLQFDFDFYSGEWPEYVCTPFNDSFIAWLQSAAFPGTPPGDLNISFDAKNNPVSVNNAFFETCTMGASTGCCASSGPTGCGGPTGTATCVNGPQTLGGTGYEDIGTYCGGQSTGGGATGWLTTKAPVKAGEVITLQFIIWDTGDPNWDSSVLLDHFTWEPGPTMTGTAPAQ
jgi:hypothetical protein